MNLTRKVKRRAQRGLSWLSDRLQGLPRPVGGAMTKEQIAQLLQKPDPVILEIGCNDGSNTLWFLELFQSPRVYCFEPEPRAIERFKERVGERANVTLVPIALSDRTGETTFHRSNGARPNAAQALPKGYDRSGSIRKPKEHLQVHPWVTFEETITVATSTLDAWAEREGIGTVDFIWMDVQGAERDVIEGGRRTLARTRYLYTEYASIELYEGQASLRQLVRLLPEFRLATRYRGDVLFAHRGLAEPASGAPRARAAG